MPIKQVSLMTRRAAIAPNSVNEKARTATVVFSTGAAVQRRDFEGPYSETLSLDAAAVDLTRLRGGPMLNGHRQGGAESVIGVVLDARIADGKATAEVKFSARADVEAIFTDVRDGIVRNVSVGYTVEKWNDATDPTTGQRTRTATRWTPHELSLVAVAADPGATVRSSTMDDETTEVTTTETAPVPAAERGRVDAEIRGIAAIAGLDETFATGLITRQASVDDARRAAFEEMARRGGGPIHTQAVPRVVMGEDWSDMATRATHIGEALYTRINPAHEPAEAAREFVGLSLPEIGRLILKARGLPITGLAPETVITRALHTTSDFSLILGDTVGRSLRAAYTAAPAGVRALAQQTTVRDFRAKHRLQLSEAETLEKVNEAGEFKTGTMSEARETYKADTFGRIFGISRQAMVNDDLGAFTDLAARFGVAAAEFEAQTLVDLLTSGSGDGPTLSDSKALFHADHGNKAASGAAPDETTLSAARLAMRTQTGLAGRPINVTPKFLLVPAALETTAEKLVATIQAMQTADVNVFGGKLMVVVDARLDVISAARWYVVADPAQFDGLEYCYLEGAPGPQTESRNGFEVDGVQVKVRLDYGAGFVEHRGWYMNAGQ